MCGAAGPWNILVHKPHIYLSSYVHGMYLVQTNEQSRYWASKFMRSKRKKAYFKY